MLSKTQRVCWRKPVLVLQGFRLLSLLTNSQMVSAKWLIWWVRHFKHLFFNAGMFMPSSLHGTYTLIYPSFFHSVSDGSDEGQDFDWVIPKHELYLFLTILWWNHFCSWSRLVACSLIVQWRAVSFSTQPCRVHCCCLWSWWWTSLILARWDRLLFAKKFPLVPLWPLPILNISLSMIFVTQSLLFWGVYECSSMWINTSKRCGLNVLYDSIQLILSCSSDRRI